MSKIKVFTGNAHPALAAAVCELLRDDGVELGGATVGAFSDGETQVQIHDNVRNADVYVIQPTCAPANQTAMELFVMVDALRRASAGSITAVVPYYGYARQDRKAKPRTPITASLVAHLLEAASVDRVVAVDLHAAQIQGFFRMPVDNLFAKPVLLPYLVERYAGAVIVSPDAGGVERARAYSKGIPDSTLAIIDKRRERANVSEVMHVIGEVEGKKCLILDDMVDTAGTLVNAARALVDRGAKSVAACATHGVLSGDAEERIRESALTEVIVTNTIPLRFSPLVAGGRVKVVSVAPLLASAIRRIHRGESLSELFT